MLEFDFRRRGGSQNFGGFRGRAQDEGFGEADFQQMFGSGEACGGFERVRQARNAQKNSFGSNLGAEAGGGVHAGPAQRAGEAKDTGEGTDFILLRRGQLGEDGIFFARFRAAVIADGREQDGPIFRQKTWRDRQSLQEFVSGLLRGFSLRRFALMLCASVLQVGGGTEQAACARIDENGRGFCAAQRIEE